MNKLVATFLQAVVVLIGLCMLVFMLWEPHLEGRNVNATFFQIYFNDPFLAYVYATSIAFFIGLYQVLMLLSDAGKDQVFSVHFLKAVRTIKYCAISLVGFILLPLLYLFIVRPGDDIAGGVAIGIFSLLGSLVVAISAAMFEKFLKNKITL